MKKDLLFMLALLIFCFSACKKEEIKKEEEEIIKEEVQKLVSADFTADVTKVYEATSVKFAATETQNISAYKWTFEGGTPETSTKANPEVSFENYGKFNVSLEVSSENHEDSKTASDYITVVPSEGLVSYFPFNGNAEDEMDQVDGTINGAIMVNDRNGNANGAYQFDGLDDFINLGDVEVYKFDSSFTINMWFYREGEGSGPHGSGILINNETRYELGVSKDYIALAVSNDSPGWTWRGTTVSYADKTWHFISFKYDKGHMEILLNGESIFTFQGSGIIEKVGNPEFVETHIGGRQGPSEHFNGMIDEVSIFSSALSNDAIKFIYEEGMN